MSRHFSSTLLAACSAAILAAAVPGAAAASYKAEPAAAPSSDHVVVRGLLWKCGAGGCVSGKSTSRAAVDCAALVREIGAVKTFSVDGRELGAEDLQKCNLRAK
jgi:hypothetical protein